MKWVDSEYRYVVLSICVLLAALALTWTGDTLLENIPLALFAVGSAVWLYRKQAALYDLLKKGEGDLGQGEAAGHLSRISSAVNTSKGSQAGWRHLVRAPKVEDSWETLASCIVQEFVYDLWYVFITSDYEFPAAVRVVLNGAFGELALRGRALDLPSIISETCEVFSEQLELFRNTREEVGPSFNHLSYVKRDYKLKKQLEKTHMLHPAVVNEKQKKQVLKLVFDVVSSVLLNEENASRPVLRIIVRELLANSVIEPLLGYFTPMQGNGLMHWALSVESKKDEDTKEEEEKPKEQGDIKWRAKQSVEYESRHKKNPSLVYVSGMNGRADSGKDNGKDKGKNSIPDTIEESEEANAKEIVSSGSKPSFSCKPVVKVLSADEKYYQNIQGKKRFIVYTINVKEGYKSWYIYRRYRNFSTLHRRMKILPGYNFRLPQKRIFARHMSDQFVQNRCDALNLYIHQVLHSSVWQCQELSEFLSENSEVYGIQSREEENVLQRMTTDIADVTKAVSKKFESAYEGFGNVLANECRRVGSTSGKVLKKVLLVNEWGSSKKKKEENRPSAQELSEQVKLFHELKSMKDNYKKTGTGTESKLEEKSEEDLITEYLNEVSHELYIRTAVDNMTAPILDVIDVLFQLDTKDWLRRQVVGATKQLFEMFVGSRVEKFLMNKIKMLCTEETVASIIDSITDALWPNGVWMIPPEEAQNQQPVGAAQGRPRSSGDAMVQAEVLIRSPTRRATMDTTAPPNGPAFRRCSTMTLNEGKFQDYTRIQRALSSIMPPEHLEIMNDEEKEIRDKVKAKLKELVPPKAVSTLIGKKNFIQGLEDLFDFIQSETMMAQLGQLVLEILLVKEFPELEPVYSRIKSGDLSHKTITDESGED